MAVKGPQGAPEASPEVSAALAVPLRVVVGMTARVTRQQLETLIAEIDVYLGAIDVFRAEGCEPRWRNDSVPDARDAKRRSGRRRRAPTERS